MKEYDEKTFFIKPTLRVFQEQRKRLLNDWNSDNMLHKAFYEQESPKMAEIYLNIYFLEWLLDHWSELTDEIEKHSEYTVDCKKGLTIYFSRYFKSFLQNETIPVEIIEPQLYAYKKSLDTILRYNEKWKEESDIMNNKSLEMKAKCKFYIDNSIKNKGDV